MGYRHRLAIAIALAATITGMGWAQPTRPATGPATALSPEQRFDAARPWLERAHREATALEDPQQRLQGVAEVSQLYARAGQVEAWDKAVAQMEALAKPAGVDSSSIAMYRSAGLGELLPALVRANRLDQARQMVKTLEGDEQAHLGAMTRLVTALAEAGQYGAADELLATAPPKSAESLLYALALGQARRGDEKAALETAAELTSPALSGSVRYTLAARQLESGDVAAATRTAEGIDGVHRDSAIAAIFDAQSKAGRFAEARKTIDRAEAAERRDRMFLDLVFRQSLAGDLDGMRRTVGEMAGQSQEVPAANLVVRELVKRGDEAGASRFIESLKDEKVRQRVADTLPQFLIMSSAEAGDAKRAEAHLLKLPEEKRNFTFCISVAGAMYKSNDRPGARRWMEAARAWADAKPNVSYRATTYRQVTYQHGLHGDVDEAIKAAQALEKPAERDGALAGAVYGCAQAGDLRGVWKLIQQMGPGSERQGAVNVAAHHAVWKGQTADLARQVDALAPADRVRACLAIVAASMADPPVK